jgi:hypothetical protein
MRTISTLKVVITMLVLSLMLSAIAAYFGFPGFFLAIFLVPALTAAYFQRMHGLHFERPERKRISLWYVAASAGVGVIPLALLINATKDQLKEPLWQIVLALVIGVIVLASMAYFIVYWVMGLDFSSKQRSP